MANYKGPCLDCGAPVDRYIKPKRKPRCLDCAVVAAAQAQAAAAAKTGKGYHMGRAAGEEFARQVSRGGGGWYEKWLKGVRDAAAKRSTTKSPKRGTVTPET